MKTAWKLTRETLREFVDDRCPRMAAALAYYTVLSLPALLVLVISVTGLLWGPDAVRGRIESEVTELMGPEAARAMLEMATAASQSSDESMVALLLGVLTLVFGASGAFAQLQDALNQAWEVEPERGGFQNFLGKRLLSFAMILAIVFLLIVSLWISAALSAMGEAVGSWLSGTVADTLLFFVEPLLSVVVITLLFAAMFKFLPDAEVAWRDVWIGALLTTTLFLLGKVAMGFYFGRSNPGSAYGAAGSVVLVMVWIYYASMIVLLGAELTQVWARRFGSLIVPEEGAVQVVEHRTRVSREVVQQAKTHDATSD